jgi:ubiquinone/menaquinone biosynthesis C-methylase UbiE
MTNQTMANTMMNNPENLSEKMIEVFKGNQDAYDRIVMEFARRNHTPLEGDLLLLAQKLVQHVESNGFIIDIGCGTGRDMAYFESQGLQVTGVDLSAGMLSFARRHVRGGLALMNMCRMGFSEACFEAAWSCASLLHVPKQAAPAALQEVHRILKPGGMLILTIQEGISEGWEESYVDGIKRFFVRYRKDEMQTMLSMNGFTVGKVDSFSSHTRLWLSFTCILE